ncbi:MAG: hypothetical protein HZA79_09205 [Sphingobacteriales bacterium]|nr:hypothetical protein [Sphingobacteriales bacterium]
MKKKTAIFALLLTTPVLLFLLHHYFFNAPGLHATGFTVNENVLYMSYARQYQDQGNFSIFYSNPFDGDPASPRIYFQPVTLVFSFLLRLGADPGLCLSLFGLLMAFLTVYTGLLILRQLLGKEKSLLWPGLLFTWGGGLLSLAGLAAWIFLPGVQASSWEIASHLADPAWGWWGLNWGRNLFIPMEAFYHFLFLLNIYLLLRQKWIAGIGTALLLSVSHPFTGIEYLLIMNGWLLLERFVSRQKTVPLYYLAGHLLITAFHLWYYLYYLNGFPEHRQLFEQYSASWTYSLRVAIPAYALIGVLALLGIREHKKRGLFSLPQQRLFLCWALISFFLSKHEWFIKPMQPLHFTRGYTWAGLFFLALPFITWLLEEWKYRWRKPVIAVLLFLIFSDNITWTWTLLKDQNTQESESHIGPETREILAYLQKTGRPQDLLTGNAPLVMYMTNAYSGANAWVSHPYNTPEIQERSREMDLFLSGGGPPLTWQNRRILVLVDKENKNSSPVSPQLLQKKIFENKRYLLATP